MTTIISWNVNGIRAAAHKGFLEWLLKTQPDFLCVQETKAQPDQVARYIAEPMGYSSLWQSAERKGYSGVATFFKTDPLSVQALGISAFDSEGRVQVLEYPRFTLVNAYFPNSRPERARLDYKLAFFEAVTDLCNRLRDEGKSVVLCGDFNVAHEEIDLARPKQNHDNPGFYDEEREAMTDFLNAGYIDTFRHFTKEPGHYTWWSYRAGARARNVGWRIDYHCVNEEFMPEVKDSYILPEVMGSDHCPLALIT